MQEDIKNTLQERKELHTERKTLEPAEKVEVDHDFFDFGWIFWAVLIGAAVYFLVRRWRKE